MTASREANLELAQNTARMETTEIARTSVEEYYKGYDARKGAARNDLLRNPEVLFQVLAADASRVSALRFIRPDPSRARVLDVGCGDGTSLMLFLRLGFDPGNLYGVDIRTEQIHLAQAKLPSLHLECSDASRLGFPDDTFDIVYESMMFLQLTDADLSRRIAREMVRVAKPGAYLVLSDWRYGKPGRSEFKALNKERIAKLFGLNDQTTLCRVFRGSLIPPVGRYLSKYFPWSYFLVRALMPAAAGQVTTVLRKTC